MEKKVFRSPGELKKFLAQNGYPKYALSAWAEAPPMGEAFLFSDTLRPLLEYAIGFESNSIQILPKANSLSGEWTVENLDDPPRVFGATRDIAMENFWGAIEEDIRGMGRECQLFVRETIISESLRDFLRDWTFAEEVRLTAVAIAPITLGQKMKSSNTGLRLIGTR